MGASSISGSPEAYADASDGLGEVLSRAAESGSPMTVRENGRAAGVVMTMTQFSELMEQIEELELDLSVEESRRHYEEHGGADAHEVIAAARRAIGAA